MRFGSGDTDEMWFYSSGDAEAETKGRLGLKRLHELARETRWEIVSSNSPTCEHDNEDWKCVHRREYSQMHASSGKQDAYGFVRIDRMQRSTTQPFVNPFTKP